MSRFPITLQLLFLLEQREEKIGWKSTTGQNDHVNDYFICNTE